MTDISDHLEELKETGLYRRLRAVQGPQGPSVLLDGRPALLLCSNNYLGLADHPKIREATARAAMRWGAGAGASRLISGNMSIHRRLEERLATFTGRPSALLYGSGYLANLGVVSALAREGDIVFSDELNHASIIDGCRLARAEVFVYRHADMEHLAWGLARAEGRGSLIVTESIFSMDGDLAPLVELAELADEFDCRLMVDEAHAFGCVGSDGSGAVSAAGLTDEVDVVVGTLGKALGSYGAFVASSREVARYLINTSRPFIFSTALAPPAVAAAIAALDLLEDQPERVDRVRRNATVLREALGGQGFELDGSDCHIIPLVVGEPDSATALCDEALGDGVFAQAIRPPTVPAGTSRLRLTVMATHREPELRRAAETLGSAARRLGLVAAPLRAAAPLPPEPASGVFDLERAA